MAQKLHGVSAKGSDRVRDLIDLQLIMANDIIDLSEVRRICERLFIYRKCQPWPTIITKGELWEELYNSQRGELDVLPSVDEAIAWANELIEKIDSAG